MRRLVSTETMLLDMYMTRSSSAVKSMIVNERKTFKSTAKAGAYYSVFARFTESHKTSTSDVAITRILTLNCYYHRAQTKYVERGSYCAYRVPRARLYSRYSNNIRVATFSSVELRTSVRGRLTRCAFFRLSHGTFMLLDPCMKGSQFRLSSFYQLDISNITMKLFAATTAIVSVFLAHVMDQVQAENDQGAAFYFTLGATGGGCIGLKRSTAERGDRLILRECSLTDDSIQWTIDDESRFRSKLNIDMCVQAGVTGSAAGSGTALRMVPCGVSDLQKFDLSEFSGDGSFFGPIKPAASPALCVVHRGPNANIDADPIVLKECSNFDDDRTQGWEGKFQVEPEPVRFFTFNAPGGGCIGLKNGSAHRGNRLLLRTCSLEDESLQWIVDAQSRFHSKVNLTMCIQAGITGSSTTTGSAIRIVPCGVSDLQRFDVSGVRPVVGGLQGPIKPAGSPELCMVHRGVNGNVDSDPIIFRTCDALDEVRAQGWEIDYLDFTGSV